MYDLSPTDRAEADEPHPDTETLVWLHDHDMPLDLVFEDDEFDW